MSKEKITPSKIGGRLRLPSSKSIAHRMLISAALARNSKITGVTLSNDINATAGALKSLGAELEYSDGTFTFKKPCSREIDCGIMDCGESASTLRFMIPVIAALGNKGILTGSGRLPERTTTAYKIPLTSNGAILKYPDEEEKYLPLEISGQLRSGKFDIEGNISSQFITGLLFACTVLNGESVIHITTPLESKPYIDLTIDCLKKFGAEIKYKNGDYFIHPAELSGEQVEVEADCSQAAFFAVAAAINGDKEGITLCGINPESKQGDFRLFEILESFNVPVKSANGEITVYKSDKLTATEIDAQNIPDLVPALAVLAAFSEGKTRIFNAQRLRIKESDRIKSTVEMICALGGEAVETADGMEIYGKEKLSGGIVRTYNDHRIAMSAAAASVGCVNAVEIDEMNCINKSYPGFFNDFLKLQLKQTE